MSEPNEATTAEPVAATPTASDTAPQASVATQKNAPFWKRLLGKS